MERSSIEYEGFMSREVKEKSSTSWDSAMMAIRTATAREVQRSGMQQVAVRDTGGRIKVWCGGGAVQVRRSGVKGCTGKAEDTSSKQEGSLWVSVRRRSVLTYTNWASENTCISIARRTRFVCSTGQRLTDDAHANASFAVPPVHVARSWALDRDDDGRFEVDRFQLGRLPLASCEKCG